ncbi:MAG: hypothetical protein JWM11_2755 [Planctomycetaceae bacterium]|nr:hypothetical protein [Planctomycetaceae bacterium]
MPIAARDFDRQSKRNIHSTVFACALFAACLISTNAVSLAEPNLAPVSYSRDVRPILADKCFHCHGADPSTRKAELRLDDETSARKERNGAIALVPGQPDRSELIQRIHSTDDSERMPPPSAVRQLSAVEKEILKRWVEQGAKYEQHWSFQTPSRPALPLVQKPDWIRNPLDHFILSRLEQTGLSPSPEADRITLIRRVTLDLTGLPATPAEVDAFLADASPDAYEKLVDRLFASPHYGERLALDWLDAARFADSGGYQGDIFRTMWPWRDWVIAAFNRNLPFDQFTIEQLAGDLLPQPTRDQLVASGFHRNHRINDEDGIILEEFRVEYVVDRVETTANVWLGLTLGCSRCHDHKYDPFTQADFYRFYAFFNSIDESGRGHGNAPPILRLTTPDQEQQAATLDGEIQSLQEKLKAVGTDAASVTPRQEIMNQVLAVQKKKEATLAAAPVTMVMRELPMPRDTFVLIRGAYDKPGERVSAALPGALPSLSPDAPRNRLGLARWLVHPGHPLTSRVIVNRYWQLIFGTGLVSTPEDFGTQGAAPSHPELMDWLATEFIQTNWDVKRFLRMLVTSATYRQSSRGSVELYRRDPDNRLLARGPRYRMPAELIRDQALAASGLLTERIGGPSVLPYQPEGLWKELASAGQEYPQSHGADLYRRSMYTFWRRTVHHPTMAAFDAPAREICAVRRPRTNTPIQALALMNEPGFVEASRSLAERTLREAGPELDARLTYAFRLVLARTPAAAELKLLQNEWQSFHNQYAAHPEAAAKLITVGESKPNTTLSPVDVATMTAIANTIFNLDEAVTKE